MEKILRQSLLYDFYGELLTPHQKRILESVLFEDLSLSEIAGEEGISRQGVSDTVRRSLHLLEDYEAKLGLVAKFEELKDRIRRIRSRTDDPEIIALTEAILEDF